MPPNGYGAASKHGLATTKLVNACRSDLCGRPRAAKTASPWMQKGKALLPLHPIPNRQTQTSKAEVSTWLRTGTFYLALTLDNVGNWHLAIGIWSRLRRATRQETSPAQLPIAKCQLPFARLKWGK